jgi:hypothetical protein
MTELRFTRLNDGWNAEPNAPEPRIWVHDTGLILGFLLNPWQFRGFTEEEQGFLGFKQVSKYRLGATNDEGWCLGQCRYSGVAPQWGQFYELTGPDAQRDAPTDWHVVNGGTGSRHFLFYFRDQTFEVVAEDWNIPERPDNALLRLSNGEQ